MFGWFSEPAALRFLLEAAQPLGVARDARGQHLDRDLAPEPRVARAVDLAHGARAERALDLVRPELDAGGQRHRVSWLRLTEYIGT